MLKQKLQKLLSVILFFLLVILCLTLSIPLFFLSNEPKLTNQTLCSMDLNNQPLQPKADNHPITASSGNTDLTKSNQTPSTSTK
uniref:F-ORF n=1 Tax=Unio crassus TaxID=143297 RepID=A0A1Q1MMI1_9BIVA|nr:F-ORF [Unio crassus]AQM37730.1 F-ORF [Unio crassus]AQM37742.1 F-ORF [Unio crassus]